MEVSCILRIRDQLSVRVEHSPREGNAFADYLANLVFIFVGDFQLNYVQDMPSEGRKILNLDKHGVPYIRRTTLW